MDYKNYWYKSRLERICFVLFYAPLCITLRILPKLKYEIFGSMNGYKVCDNSKFLFNNIDRTNKFFITKNKEYVSKKCQIIYAYSFFGLFLQMFAKKAYWTHGINDFIAPLVIGSRVVGLQHGLPGKTVVPISNGILGRIKFLLKRGLAPYLINYYCNEVWSPDHKYDASIKFVFSPLVPQIKREQIPRIKFQRVNIVHNKILFAPSHRESVDIVSILLKSGLMAENFLEHLRLHDVDFFFRPHPLTLVALNSEGIKIPPEIQIETSDDIHDTLSSYAMVITDFSGLIIDCWELGIKTACVCKDLDEIYSDKILFEWFYNELKEHRFNTIYEALEDHTKIHDVYSDPTFR